jgi:hypothetical protein
MTDMFLKFTDEEQAIEALDGYEGSIDTIGIIYKRTGGTDEDPVMTALLGWHVNVRGPESEALTQFSVEVSTPIRVWA